MKARAIPVGSEPKTTRPQSRLVRHLVEVGSHKQAAIVYAREAGVSEEEAMDMVLAVAGPPPSPESVGESQGAVPSPPLASAGPPVPAKSVDRRTSAIYSNPTQVPAPVPKARQGGGSSWGELLNIASWILFLPFKLYGRLAPRVREKAVQAHARAAAARARAQRQQNRVAPQMAKVARRAPASTVTGFGATDVAWNAHHQADDRFMRGSAYDPDPALPDPRYNDRYYAVGHTDGQVLNYEMRFPPQPEAAARVDVMREFPPDATIVWFSRKDTCAQMEVRSKALERALGTGAVGHSEGVAWVELTTGEGYDPSGVTGAILMLGSYANAAEAPGC